MTEAEVTVVAQEAADRAVARVFEHLGVDPHDHDDIYRLRQNLDFLEQARSGAWYGLKALALAILSALGLATWLGFQLLIGGWKP